MSYEFQLWVTNEVQAGEKPHVAFSSPIRIFKENQSIVLLGTGEEKSASDSPKTIKICYRFPCSLLLCGGKNILNMKQSLKRKCNEAFSNFF